MARTATPGSGLIDPHKHPPHLFPTPMKKPTPFLSISTCYVTDLDRATAAKILRYSRTHPSLAPMRRHSPGFYIFSTTTISTR